MRLKGEEFLRRFCLHILPKGFVKIRHYGIYSTRFRSTVLKSFGQMVITISETTTERIKRVSEIDVCLFQLKSIPEFQSKSIPFKLNKKRAVPFRGYPRKGTARSPDFVSIVFHFFIIFFVSLILYDSPFIFTRCAL